MEFAFTGVQEQLRRAVREYAEDRIAPHVLEWDEAQAFPLDVVNELGKRVSQPPDV